MTREKLIEQLMAYEKDGLGCADDFEVTINHKSLKKNIPIRDILWGCRNQKIHIRTQT